MLLISAKCFYDSLLSLTTVTIFVEDNHGAPASVLHALKFFGTQVHGTNVSAIHQ